MIIFHSMSAAGNTGYSITTSFSWIIPRIFHRIYCTYSTPSHNLPNDPQITLSQNVPLASASLQAPETPAPTDRTYCTYSASIQQTPPFQPLPKSDYRRRRIADNPPKPAQHHAQQLQQPEKPPLPYRCAFAKHSPPFDKSLTSGGGGRGIGGPTINKRLLIRGLPAGGCRHTIYHLSAFP